MQNTSYKVKQQFPLGEILGLLEKQVNCVFLESARVDSENRLSYLFINPKEIISTSRVDQVESSLFRLDQALKEGSYVAGFISYEAGEAFEDKLKRSRTFDFPLLWFGVYQEPLIYDHCQGNFKSTSQKIQFLIKQASPINKLRNKSYCLKNIKSNISKGEYIKDITRIKRLIAKGLTYQVNYTFKLKFDFSGSESSLYLNLRDKQSVAYASLIKTAECSVISFSPELFFRKGVRQICTRPMKGTAQRGRNLKEDLKLSRELKASAKNRSENLMIVDLLRNDLGRISVTGSVRVPRLFRIEKYQTLFQMTSDVKSRIKDDCSCLDIFKHIFPSGSVTGAPKIKTMQIIRKLEKEPRNIYTGGIGFLAPDKTGVFNIAIRTLLIDKAKGKGQMGVGSGIVYDSDPISEFNECNLKADFLTKKSEDFQLIETMLCRPNREVILLDLHLKRLENSAKYFDFIYQQQEILKALAKIKKHLKPSPHRLRLLLDKEGNVKICASLLKSTIFRKRKICISTKKTNSENLFLYHKTTNRYLYDQEYSRHKRLGFYDTIFCNEKNEITEGAISNIFIRKNNIFYTPPITCGLLDGVYRQRMFIIHKRRVKEKVLFKKDILTADEIYLSNSVRGLVKVQIEAKNH